VSLVVSDSGPLHYLVLCDAIQVVPKLYGQLVIPSAVARELAHPHTPPVVRDWIQTPPPWTRIATPAQTDPATHLGIGEREAMALALELKATQLLIDDRAARRTAVARGLSITGTVGVMEQAAASGYLNLSEALKKLSNTNFRISADVVREMMGRDAARRRTGGHGK
jgi:predicted nucleic acid-binding protein